MATIQPLLKPFHPIINWNNPIAKGLVFDMPFLSTAGTKPIENVTGLTQAYGGSPTLQYTKYGNSYVGSASNNTGVNCTTVAAVNSLTLMSCEFLCYARSYFGTTSGNRIFAKGANADTAKYFDAAIYGASSAHNTNALELQRGAATTPSIWESPINSFPLNTWVHCVFTWNLSALANAPIIYINGVSVTVGNPAAGSGAITSDTTQGYVGNRSDLTRGYDGFIPYVRIWNRLLTATEAQSLYTNPWQIYVKPNYSPFYVPSPAVVGTAVKMQAIRGWSFPV